MKFTNIVLEGVDCSGKSTLYSSLHKKTDYAYNIHDRSNLSMYVHSAFYGRKDQGKWYDEFWNDLKNFKTLYVVLLPDDDVIKARIEKRGDEIQTTESAIELNKSFKDTCLFHFRDNYPNILLIKINEDSTVEGTVESVLSYIKSVKHIKGSDVIKNLVYASGKNELVNLSYSEDIIKREDNYKSVIMWEVLEFPPEKDYYNSIREEIILKIEKEFMGMNEHKSVQKADSRRFIYSSDTCISLVHGMFRSNTLDVNVTMRSSNISNTLWADYEFLKILCLDIANAINLDEIDITLTLQIRSAHINP